MKLGIGLCDGARLAGSIFGRSSQHRQGADDLDGSLRKEPPLANSVVHQCRQLVTYVQGSGDPFLRSVSFLRDVD